MKKNEKRAVTMSPKQTHRTDPRLLRNPHVQAAALAHMAVWQTYDDNQEDADDYTSKSNEWVDPTFKAMGVRDDSARADEVRSAVHHLAFDMQSLLIKHGLLQKDCGRKWQQLSAELKVAS